MATRYPSYSEGRAHFKPLLDAAHNGQVATVQRGANQTVAVVDASRLRHALAQLVPGPVVTAEEDGWSAVLVGVPVAADGSTFDATIDEFIIALQDYAEDWQERLYLAPNRQQDWGLVQLTELSTPAQLRSWAVGQPVIP